MKKLTIKDKIKNENSMLHEIEARIKKQKELEEDIKQSMNQNNTPPQEKYMQELLLLNIVSGLISDMNEQYKINKNDELKEEIKNMKEKHKEISSSVKEFDKNTKLYNDFRKNIMHQKLIEFKIEDERTPEREKPKLEIQLKKVVDKIQTIVDNLEYTNSAGNVFTYKNADDLIKNLLDKVEDTPEKRFYRVPFAVPGIIGEILDADKFDEHLKENLDDMHDKAEFASMEYQHERNIDKLEEYNNKIKEEQEIGSNPLEPEENPSPMPKEELVVG